MQPSKTLFETVPCNGRKDAVSSIHQIASVLEDSLADSNMQPVESQPDGTKTSPLVCSAAVATAECNHDVQVLADWVTHMGRASFNKESLNDI